MKQVEESIEFQSFVCIISIIGDRGFFGHSKEFPTLLRITPYLDEAARFPSKEAAHAAVDVYRTYLNGSLQSDVQRSRLLHACDSAIYTMYNMKYTLTPMEK